jgi:EAL domain-containing protein (putative c-di-GMP-specific phosphodiesterase class I)
MTLPPVLLCGRRNSAYLLVIKEYKNAGFSIAFDDINCALTNINKIAGINPDYIKVGGRFVRGIETDIDKRVELSSVIAIAKMINAKVVAIGIETESELEVLYSMGVDAAQGNLICIPQKEIKGVSEQVKEMIAKLRA